MKRKNKINHDELESIIQERTTDLTNTIKVLKEEVNKRKTEEERILRDNEFMRTVFEAISHPFYVLNVKNYTIEMANSAAIQDGMERSYTCYSMIHGKDHQCDSLGYTCPLEIVSETKKPVIVDHIHYNEYGEPQNMEVHGYPIFDREGNLVQMAVCTFDVTDRKRAEEMLRESEEKYRTLVECSPGFIFLLDREGRVLDINPSVGQHKLEALTTTHVYDDIYRDDQEIFKENINACFQANRICEFEVRNFDKQRIYQVILGPVGILNGLADYIVCDMYDISERKKAEEALKRTANELAHSNADLQQFAYVASHDLQEPLRMVASYVQLLGRKYQGKLDSDADDFIGFAIDGVNRMQTLINDLLKFSRVGTKGKPLAPTDCMAVLQTKLQDLKLAIEENNAVVTYDSLPTVLADDTQLGQLFQNLISNAIKFRNENSPRIHIGVERIDGHWKFSVKDNGIGIDPQYQERVFVIFQRLHTRAEYSGTGIGLAVCKKIVERHGGKIWFESKLGEGSTFHFTIPALDGESL